MEQLEILSRRHKSHNTLELRF